jgi:chemotaxis protein CheX
MELNEIKIFIQGVLNYFNQFDGEQPVVGIPFPTFSDFIFLDYSGVIGVSGNKKGCIYVTASLGMVNELLKAMSIGDVNESLRLDVIGELANNISGNAEHFFGQNFRISVPMVVTGQGHNIHLPKAIPVITIPFEWKSHKSFLVVGMP